MKFFLPAFLIGIFSNLPVGHAQEKSLLWEISGNGLASPSYLYGTIHMIGKKDFFVREEVDSAFSKCGQVAFEIDLDDMKELASMQAWINLPEDLTLDAIMTADQYNRIKNYFADSLGLDIRDFNHQKPFYLYQQFLFGLEKGEQESYEIYFLTKSMSEQKPITGLEKISDEFRVIDKMSYAEQIGWVLDGIDSVNAYRDDFKDLIKAYRDEDLEKLQIMLAEDPVVTGEFETALLTERNQNWMDEIVTLTHQMPTFIAVGAMHLPGENGLIHLLSAQGYTVKPVLKN